MEKLGSFQRLIRRNLIEKEYLIELTVEEDTVALAGPN